MHVTYGSTNLSTLGGLVGTSSISSFRVTRQDSPRGVPDTYTVSMGVRGEICLNPDSSYTTAQAQDAINTAVLALEAALDGHDDLVFRKDSGAATAHQLLGSQSIGGVRLVGPTYDDTGPAEFATGRKWAFEASAVFDDPAADELYSYEESVTAFGGGPRYRFVETYSGEVRKYTTADVTVGTMIQTGTMTGRTQHLLPPPSADPVNYIDSESTQGKVRPNIIRGIDRGYKRTWRYVHKKSGPYDLPEFGGV